MLKGPDNVTNPFNFNKWQSTPVEAFIIKNIDSLGNVLYEMSADIWLKNSKELSSLKKTDTYSTISRADSTGNAPNNTSTHLVRSIFADDVYTNLEEN